MRVWTAGSSRSYGRRATPACATTSALTDVELRSRTEPADGLFVAEGAKVIRRAVAAGLPPFARSCSAPRWRAGLADVVEPTGAPAYVADETLLEAVTGYAVHRGALASCARRPLPSVETAGGRRRVVVLEDLTDHTNVGLVFRSAAALGIDAVLLAPRCADPLYRRAVKTSMGAVLTLPYARFDTLVRRRWTGSRDAGFTVLALTPDPAAEPLDEVLAGLEPGAGSRSCWAARGTGCLAHWMRSADHRVRIRQRSEVDSLNVAAAAAIACYALAATVGA